MRKLSRMSRLGYRHYNPLAAISSYFRDKGATSPSQAITMKSLDWTSLGIQTNTLDYKFIRQTEDSKYWIDSDQLRKHLQRNSSRRKILKLFIGAIILCMIVFTILILVVFSFIFTQALSNPRL